MINVSLLTKQAVQASKKLALLSTEAKNAVLKDMAVEIDSAREELLTINLNEVRKALEAGLDDAFVDRLTLTGQRIDAMIDGLFQVAELDDPVGKVRSLDTPDSGIEVEKLTTPLGVICMIYEARPNVTADAAALCFKSGNAVILRGGKEALETSKAIAECLHAALRKHDLPESAVIVVPTADRSLMTELLQQKDHIDLVIPRGGEGLINYVSEASTIPVIQHYKGVCHLYVHKDADLAVAQRLIENGKVQRPGVCNALECVLVHEDIVSAFMPMLEKLAQKHGVQLHACSKAKPFLPMAEPLAKEDYGTEYLSLDLAVRVVRSVEHAIEHIDTYGSRHTEVICTTNKTLARQFQSRVDASVVMANASSRFSDGSQLGLGAEIGIATTKLHAYGPMGLESLTTEKFIVHGDGQIRA